MKKFKFRLQSVLDAREKVLEDKQLELAKLQNKLYQQQMELESLNAKKQNYSNDLESNLNTGQSIDFLSIKNYRDYIDKLTEDITKQLELMTDTNKEIDKKKQEVLEAHKNKEILSKLKEKDIKKFNKEFERVSGIETDEIALSRFGKSY